MLHAMERKGYLPRRKERIGNSVRKFYSATEAGLEGVAVAKERLREFIGEAMKT